MNFYSNSQKNLPLANDEMRYGRFIIRGSKKRIKMVGTRFRTLKVNKPQRHEIEPSAPKFQINQPKPKKPRVWRSKRSAAMGYFWTKTERGKSWKRWTADKEAYGAKWSYYLMSGTNIPYLNPERFIERNGYRVIELRMKRSAIRDAVESRIKEIHAKEKRTAQEEKTENHAPTILGIRVEEDKRHKEAMELQINREIQAPKMNGQMVEEEQELRFFSPDEYYALGATFEKRGWNPSAVSLKINPDTIDFTSEETVNHIGIQVAFGMNALQIDEEEFIAPKTQADGIALIAKALTILETTREEETAQTQGTEATKTVNARISTKRIRGIESRNRIKRSEHKRNTHKKAEKIEASGEIRKGQRTRQTPSRKPQRRDNSGLLRGGVRVRVIKSQRLRLASAGVSLPPEKN